MPLRCSFFERVQFGTTLQHSQGQHAIPPYNFEVTWGGTHKTALSPDPWEDVQKELAPACTRAARLKPTQNMQMLLCGVWARSQADKQLICLLQWIQAQCQAHEFTHWPTYAACHVVVSKCEVYRPQTCLSSQACFRLDLSHESACKLKRHSNILAGQPARMCPQLGIEAHLWGCVIG